MAYHAFMVLSRVLSMIELGIIIVILGLLLNHVRGR